MDHAPKSRDLFHLSTWVTCLREINAASAHTQRDPHCDSAIHISPRYAIHLHLCCFRAKGIWCTDDLLYMTGNGDSGALFEQIASAMVFCATNPDRDANGSVWALFPNGTLQQMEEARETESDGKLPEYTER